MQTPLILGINLKLFHAKNSIKFSTGSENAVLAFIELFQELYFIIWGLSGRLLD